MRAIVKYLLLLFIGIFAASCVFDAEPCTMPIDEARSIIFTISLDNQRTKTTWENIGQSDSDVPFDSRILPDDLRVIVFAADGTRLGSIRNLYYWPINEDHTQFYFMGEMPEGFAEFFNAHSGQPEYRFMVLANCDENLSGEQYITYGHSQLDPSLDRSSIPMWGVKEVDLTDMIDQERLDIGAIWLLRAAAKIEVKLSPDIKHKASINAATLKYYNKTGYCLPTNGMSVSDTRLLDRNSCINVYRHASADLAFIKDEDTGDHYIYVTEYDNENYPAERNKISLEFNVGGQIKYFEDAISFCQYSGGRPQDGTDYSIVRNHIYEFEILSVAGSQLTLNYEVADWQTEEWNTGKDYEDHDLTYPTYHNPVVPREFFSLDDDEISSYVITQLPEMYHHNGYDEEVGAFECFFQIMAPVGVNWKPIINASKENYTVRAYRFPGGELLYDTGNSSGLSFLGPCGENEWYRIVVFPLTTEGAGETEVDFGISYYQEWTDQYINLYVNGDYGNIRWPDSGDNPKIIKIRHVMEN